MADARVFAEFARTNQPFATLGELADAREQREDRKLARQVTIGNLQARQQELADREQERAQAGQRQALIQSTFQKHVNPQTRELDQEGLLADLQASGDMTAYESVAKSLNAQQDAKIKQEKAAREADQAEADFVSAQMRDVTPETYAARRSMVIARHPKASAVLPPQYDPQAIEHIINAALSNDEWLKRVDKLEAQTNDKYGRTLVNIALADTPDKQAEAFAMAGGLAVARKLAADGVTPEAVQRMTPEQRRQLLLKVPGLTPNAIFEALKPKEEKAAAQGSDYGRFEADFLDAEAAKRGKTVDQLTPGEKVQIKTAARKQYGQADDAARRPLAPIVIQTGSGPQLLDRTTGTAKNVTDASGQVIGQAPTADMRNKAAGRALVAKSISSIKDIGDTIITRVGPAQRADALKRGASAVFGNDPDFKTYQDARMALAGNLAVAQQGSRPSDADIKSIWLPLVPDPYSDTKASADRKWALIRTMSNVDANGAAPAQPAAPQPKERYNPVTGKTEPIK